MNKTYEVIISEPVLKRKPTERMLTTLRGKPILPPEQDEFYSA